MTTDATTYFWFKGDTIAALVAAIETAGGASVARLECRQDGDKMYLHVLDANKTVVARLNDSLMCPPFC